MIKMRSVFDSEKSAFTCGDIPIRAQLVTTDITLIVSKANWKKKKCEMKNHNCVCAQSCPTLWDPMDCSTPGSSVYGNFPGKNTEEGCHFLLQGIFLAQGSNPCLLHWQADSLPQHHLGSPKTTITVSVCPPPFSYCLKSKKKSFLSPKDSKNM